MSSDRLEAVRAAAVAPLKAANRGRRDASTALAERVTPAGVLTASVALYVLVFGQLTWAQQSNFGTFGFDMGIYDQAIWLLSRFKNPFDTIRGLNYFGFHVNVIAFALVPIYWLGGGPHALYLIETIALALGAVPLWLLARDRFENEWLALGPAVAYLLFPSIEWINWWHFHPEALAITPLFFAWWFASRGRWWWFALATGVALSCKEDVALAVLAMGVAIALRYSIRAGAATAAVGVAWFVICTRLIIPHYDGGQAAFYLAFNPTLGHSLQGVIATIIRHPSRLYRLMVKQNRHTYYIQLLAPVAFLPIIGGWSAALIGLPQLVINTTSVIGYAYSIKFHYSSMVVVGVWLATVESMARRASRPATRGALVAVLVACALAANVAWSPSPLSVHYRDGEWARPSALARAEATAVKQVTNGKGVSASYSIDTHLTHRAGIYEWPNPFVPTNWGFANRDAPPPSVVDWLVLDTSIDDAAATQLLDQLTGPGGGFTIVFEQSTVIVARRQGT